MSNEKLTEMLNLVLECVTDINDVDDWKNNLDLDHIMNEVYLDFDKDGNDIKWEKIFNDGPIFIEYSAVYHISSHIANIATDYENYGLAYVGVFYEFFEMLSDRNRANRVPIQKVMFQLKRDINTNMQRMTSKDFVKLLKSCGQRSNDV